MAWQLRGERLGRLDASGLIANSQLLAMRVSNGLGLSTQPRVQAGILLNGYDE